MIVVWIALAAVVVFVIAAVVVGRETTRLADAPPRPVFSVDEAVLWIADRLPDDITARTSHAEVRAVVEQAVNHQRLWEPTDTDRMVTDEETWAYVVERVELDGEAVSQILAVHARYLTAIGAAGPVAFEPPERGGGPAED